MAQKVRMVHVHIPDVSIPDDDRSDTESRAVAWHVKVSRSRVVVRVATGDFSLHLLLVGQVTGARDVKPSTRIDLPAPLRYETAVLLGLTSEEGQVSLFCSAEGAREGARLGDEETRALLRRAAAGVAEALRRGHDLDRGAPSGEPHDLDQLPDPVMDEFDVTADMLERFERGIEGGTVVLHEELARGDSERGGSARAAQEPRDVSVRGGSARRSVSGLLASHAVRGDPWSR